MPNTVRLHRVLATRPDKVYRAFLEPDALAKWLPPSGYACTVHQLDAKIGSSLLFLGNGATFPSCSRRAVAGMKNPICSTHLLTIACCEVVSA
jgi:uncharacterized protein YndB with AHSA1/START domain